jgi:tetratricopeptide (TPR) repeat protein
MTSLSTLLAVAALAAPAVADLPAPGTAKPEARKRAELLAARQSWDDAIAAYREAIAAHPRDAALRNRLGICHQRKGDVRAARSAYRKALDLRRDYAEAWNNLGTLEHARRKYKQAISAYAKAIRLRPADAVFHRNLGAAWLARGDVARALEAWGEALRLDPAGLDGDALGVPGAGVTLARQCFLYAKLLAARGDTARALEYLTKAHAAGFDDFARVEADRDFAAVVSDPRYAALK